MKAQPVHGVDEPHRALQEPALDREVLLQLTDFEQAFGHFS